MDISMGAPETKADLARAMDDMQGAFEAFKATNEERLAEVEKKSSVDVLTTDKLARIEAALDANQRRMDDMVLKSARPALSGSPIIGASEHKSAFDGYVRGGNEAGLRSIERKAVSTSGDAGFTVPVEIEAEVMRRLTSLSPIRAIAGQRQVSSSTFKKPVTSAGPQTGWVADTDARTMTTEPTLSELQFDTMELYAMPAATSALLDDTAVNIDQWLADEIETAFAEQESKAFVVGTGIGQPKGFTQYTTVAESAWTWGSLGFVNTGVAGGFAASDPADGLVDLIYTLKAGYRQNAHFVMSRATQAAVRKMKDDNGQYIWAPPSIPGAKSSIYNFAVVESEDMPEIASGSLSIAFGDFKRGYLVVDRQGIQILRDPYSSKPYVLFYTTKRVGGGVQDFDAIKFLKFAA
ncbi:phage major capsid protein [Acuticoccus sp. MNP-M23]|uniref:phage major capsid protein n=1 Tax=Acuticoccus sp. MNP-M23 TaxID=3072793 RepID=UPI002814E8F2|nr:phage major capsid protein [Acuticoccus sp. MNP-M23]WMS41692.1 phage major capsid protein [Acuticoccus sp. MNP-M23]